MYEAHKWKIGEEITSEKLNHIEKGIEEAGLPREITDPQDGQTLKYDAAKGKWVNAEATSGGSSTLVVSATMNGANMTLDKTWQEISDAFPNAYFLAPAPIPLKMPILTVRQDGDSYEVFIARVDGDDYSIKLLRYTTDDAGGYPSRTSGPA